jgi:hypothetical protein
MAVVLASWPYEKALFQTHFHKATRSRRFADSITSFRLVCVVLGIAIGEIKL